MRNIVVLIVVTLICHPIQSFAYTPEEGKITAAFGPYISRTNYQGLPSVREPSYLGGVSLIAVGDISSSGSLEIAMIYLPSMLFYREDSGMATLQSVQVMHISMGYRWWLSPYLSTSLAFYSAYSIGEYSIVHSDFTPRDLLDTSARDATEYGFDGSVQVELFQTDKWAAVTEARYSRSVTSKNNEQSDQYGIMIGLRYQVQTEKNVEKRPE
ncbi:MAG: hypothetical protein EOP06_15510 [Proteobacteria bacterium]|nr:MAG: hypothetical protein EOP06_15510 [Pseudomonadota bacterium]